MIPNYQETEVKIYMQDLDGLHQRLMKLGADIVQERVYERNVRYDSADNSLGQRGAVLRLREDNRVKLTFKEAGVIERGIMTREELEVEVSDFATMELILSKFGFTPSMVYEKYRSVYAFGNVEIMLDELPFGNFVEIEGDNTEIEAMLDKLDLKTAERRPDSYAKLFGYVKHHMDLNFRDLTFENFNEIEVPESAFIPPGSIVIR